MNHSNANQASSAVAPTSQVNAFDLSPGTESSSDIPPPYRKLHAGASTQALKAVKHPFGDAVA
jgi:hypothetical protein